MIPINAPSLWVTHHVDIETKIRMSRLAVSLCLFAMIGATLARFVQYSSNSTVTEASPLETKHFKSEMVFIGHHNNKLYFTDRTNHLNFDEAQTECRRLDLIPADFVDEPEFLAVQEFLIPTERYWTSGKAIETFKWNSGNGEELDDSLYVHNDWRTCVVAHAYMLYADPCSGITGHSYYPLCYYADQ